MKISPKSLLEPSILDRNNSISSPRLERIRCLPSFITQHAPKCDVDFLKELESTAKGKGTCFFCLLVGFD